MKDETKEILDELDWYIKQPNNQDINGEYEPPMELSQEEAKDIYDCITNLQEENDILKRDIEAMKHNYNLLVRCIENGESITQKFENGLTYQDYKSRNEKAIEYIEEHIKYECDGTYSGMSFYSHHLYDNFKKEDLLNILQGSDK